MKKSIVLSILSLLVWSGSAQIASGFQETDNPFPPVLPNPPEIPAEEKQEEGKEGPIVIDLTQPSDVPAQGIPQNPTEGLSELTPDGPTEQVLPEPESDQKVLVREKFAGWTEAGMGENGSVLGEQLRANWVLLGNNGLLQGQVLGGAQVNAAKVPVYLLSRGRVVTQTRTDADGNFSFGNVQQGTYSLVGFGEDAFFAFGFNAIDYAESIQFRMPSKILVQAVENKTTINLDWIRYFAPNLQFRVYGRFVSKQGSADPAALYGVDGLALLAPQSAPATSVQVHPVSLTEDGELVGRVHQIDELNGRPVDVRGVRTILIQNDKVVAAASTDNFGVFSIDGVTPGDYSIVAVGNDGMGCIGIRVVANESEENARPVDFSLVSPETAGWLNHVATEVAYQRIVGRKRPESTEQCQQCGNAIPSMMNGVCGACGVCQECGGHTQYGMCGGCGTGCFGGGYGGGFGCGLRHHGGFGYGAAPYGYGAGCGSYGYGGYGGGYGYGGGRSGANGFQQFWKDINACFDMCFYGETFAYGYGNNGYGNGGYGQGGYGGYGQGAPYGYGNGGYGMDPNCPPGAYPMQGQYNGVYSGESLPGVYSPVVPEVPAVEAPQSPLVPTPASPANGY